jgi:hypothetical protein
MYQIDTTSNTIAQLSTKSFSELGFKERENLQEWIANCPDCLGEELLIIAKEFDGFDETRERLDLLALDKQGGLVVIENKLDDSGRDVVWQALKYASYCSSLSKSQIVEIYQSYLSKNGGGDAKEKLGEFLEQEDLDQVVLNSGIDQRIIMVAANFRREVTSTVLWLLQHGIRLQCVRATAFDNGGQLFLNLEQIIPTLEAEDYMIGVAEKAQEQQNAERSQLQSVRVRLQFWEKLLAGLGSAGIGLFSNVNPGKDHWLAAGSGVSGIHYTLIFAKKEARVVFDLERPNQEENKWLFDRFYEQKDAIEHDFGEELKWLRKDDVKVSRIRYRKAFDCYDKDNWPEIIDWFVKYLPRMEKAFAGRVQEISDELKTAELHH